MIIVKSSFSSSSLSVCRERRHILATATKYVWRQNMPQHNRFSPLPCSLTVASPPSQWENKHRQPATTRVATAAGTGHVHLHATGCYPLVVSRAATHAFTPGHLLAEGVPPSTQCMMLRACGKPCGREYVSTCCVTSAPPLPRPHLPPMAR